MAERVEIIDINLDDIITEGQQAGQTLKELKDQVKDLRKQLDDCVVGSDKFADTLDELTQAQDKLKNATKTSSEAIEGSYDSLVAKMSELKKAWRATADEAERADLGQQIAGINDQLKEMDASIGNYQRNVGNYASAFDDVSIKIENGVAKFDRFNNVSRSVIGSFDLVEGGLKAIGVESEEVNDLMDKMQGAMMLTNGLNSVKEGVVAFNNMRVAIQSNTAAQKILNAVMNANPIGIIVTAVAALTAGVVALTKALGDDKEKAEALKNAYDATTESIENMTSAGEFEIRMLKAKGATQEELLKQQYALAKAEFARYSALHESLLLQAEDLGMFSKKQREVLDEQINDAYAKTKEAYNKITAAYQAILIYDEEVKTQQKKEAAELAQAQIDAANKAAAAKKQAAKEAADKEIEEARRAKEAISKTYNDLKRELEEYWLNDLQLRMKHLDEWVETEKQTVRAAKENELITEQEYLDKIFELDRIYADKKKKLYEDAAKASEEYFAESATVTATKVEESVEKVTWATMETKDKVNAIAGLTGTAFGQTAQLLNTLADQQNKNTKEGFETAKKMSIAAATMSMLQGIISSWTSAMSLPAPISFITGGIMTAATATLGAVQIAQIKKQKFDGGGGDSGSSNPNIPNVNTAALLSSPVNYTTEVQGAKAVEDVKDTRVYVLESDITDTVNKVHVDESQATY